MTIRRESLEELKIEIEDLRARLAIASSVQQDAADTRRALQRARTRLADARYRVGVARDIASRILSAAQRLPPTHQVRVEIERALSTWDACPTLPAERRIVLARSMAKLLSKIVEAWSTARPTTTPEWLSDVTKVLRRWRRIEP